MIQIEDLSFSYQSMDAPVLRRVNLKVDTGKIALVTGSTGFGKSTFLKTLNGLAPHFTGGTVSGKLLIDGKEVLGTLPHDLAELVGYVNQQPEGAFATDTVEEEIVFGLEQLGWLQTEMQARVQELVAIFDLEAILKRPLVELSGGQQQRVAIAAALAGRQKLLVLDEPTSALDRRSAADILDLLNNLSKLHGITIVIAEHRLERVLSIVDCVLQIQSDGSVEKMSPDRVTTQSSWPKPHSSQPFGPILYAEDGLSKKISDQFALGPVSLKLRARSVTSVTGDNGSGKTSLLWEVFRTARQKGLSVAMVPQKAADLLFLSTVADELAEAEALAGDANLKTSRMLERFIGNLNPSTHPRDLSAGQQLALVLAIQLGADADLVILDEPTRGLDLAAKQSFASYLLELRDQGSAILVASHDADFIGAISTGRIDLQHGKVVGISD
jgi:energy-coupling factor transport system ATP-binding protein